MTTAIQPSPTPSWTRLRKYDEWGVRVALPTSHRVGDTIEVTNRSGKSTKVVLRSEAASFEDAILFRVAPVRRQLSVTAGVFEKDGSVWVVKPNRSKTGLYAKRLIELRDTQGDRVTEQGVAVRYEFQYEPGAVYRLTEADRMPLSRGKELFLRYGRCIHCGRGLKVKESVERGLGPVCASYFAPESA